MKGTVEMNRKNAKVTMTPRIERQAQRPLLAHAAARKPARR
jgi:hypothetical protein